MNTKVDLDECEYVVTVKRLIAATTSHFSSFRSTILAVGIYAKKKKVHLLTINVQITAYKQLNTWYDLSGPQLQQPSFWASICKEI